MLCGSLFWLLSCTTNNAPQPLSNQNKADTVTAKSFKKELTIYKNAIISLNNNKIEKAEKLFIEMSVLQPDIAGSWANLALINVKKGNLKEAKKYVEIALSKNPKMPQSWNLSGYLALKNGQIKNAEKYYLHAIEIKPNYALAHYNLALLYDIYLQNIEKAVLHYQQYLANTEEKDQATKDWLEGLTATLKERK